MKSVVVCVDAPVIARWAWALGLVAARVCSTRVPSGWRFRLSWVAGQV